MQSGELLTEAGGGGGPPRRVEFLAPAAVQTPTVNNYIIYDAGMMAYLSLISFVHSTPSTTAQHDSSDSWCMQGAALTPPPRAGTASAA